ncbi:hypothetical protein BSK66_10175 [Paenibacillus odorifer]|uniref:Uncharacterized protein n=1 Tax=Paenibacillus odorifer TaxID=189426 RepID=A0A1R0XDV6_9BACL|nr:MULTISPECIES: hypothetical protein [Paenibacillus]ETT45411.1 hypothetical protein C171_31981 [Paenibacillus sp. FSL H8-237]OMD33226.1 hypothetical protein BJP51_12760 [Paenibacillus odorifer]OME59705.1 hypothetical protein BSK66_10175 [Paenibacillus odorifer]
MNSAELWRQIIERAQNQAFEIHTVPQNKREPLWFRVSSDGNHLIISQAGDHVPSSTLKVPRIISFQEFDKIYPYYDLRRKGESISQEVGRKSMNTAYIYGLIADVLDEHSRE